jgi:hypothetical protein
MAVGADATVRLGAARDDIVPNRPASGLQLRAERVAYLQRHQPIRELTGSVPVLRGPMGLPARRGSPIGQRRSD